jgi:AcrR family transcriptional regulator
MGGKSKIEKVPGWKSDNTKQKIQKSALEIFAKKGFASASTRMIASKAKTNVALISRYFGGKEQLFKYVVQAEIAKILTTELPYPPQESVKSEVREYINSMISHIEANVGFFKIVVSQSLLDKKFSVFMKETIIPEYDERLLTRLNLLQEKGVFDNRITPHELSLSIRAFIVGIMIADIMLVGKSKADYHTQTESLLKVICRD